MFATARRVRWDTMNVCTSVPGSSPLAQAPSPLRLPQVTPQWLGASTIATARHAFSPTGAAACSSILERLRHSLVCSMATRCTGAQRTGAWGRVTNPTATGEAVHISMKHSHMAWGVRRVSTSSLPAPRLSIELRISIAVSECHRRANEKLRIKTEPLARSKQRTMVKTPCPRRPMSRSTRAS